MVNDFPRTLSLLRQEKKISQKNAACELGISQALLSHYENGVREPGLSFVVRAADFYGVSCDYLLGRTMSRDGASITVEELGDMSVEKGNVLRGSVMALLNKKLLINSAGILLDIIGKTGDRALITHVSAYLSTALYKMYRHVYLIAGRHSDSMFSVPASAFSELCNAEMQLREFQLRAMEAKNLQSKEPLEFPDISIDALTESYANLAPALFSTLHNVSEELEKLQTMPQAKK
ncbi:helix-turn-helix domain-containing protein [Acidaminobacterium chupaoyuni]